MASNTYVALQTQVLTGSAASVTFSSIPSTYTDLELVFNGANTSTGPIDCYYILNGDTGTNYSRTIFTGNGSSASSGRASNETKLYLAGYFGTSNSTVITKFLSYSNTSVNKTVLARAANTDTNVFAGVGLWRSNAAITSIVVYPASGAFAAGSSFTLYGIASTSAGTKATGGQIYADSTYYYHVFNSTGTFTPTSSLTADILCVAGGGGGGVGYGAGGGGGGLLEFTSQSLSATGYTVTVGAGGAAGPSSNSHGSTGSDSQFGALTLVKGGGGGGWGGSGGYGYNGGSGGGGGGGSGGGGSFWVPGSATSGQGYSGGTGDTGAGGAGGGAGGAGGNGSGTVGGAGGAGKTSTISGGSETGTGVLVSSSYYFAGGGSGNGSGGGSSPNTGGSAIFAAGAANTGQGGGGDSTTAKGGSGVVIIRYLKA